MSSLYSFTSSSPITNEGFLEKLFPNPWDFVATFLAFIVLLVIVFFFAYKPVKKLLKKRGDYVEENISEAKKKNDEADSNIVLAKKELKNARQEAVTIVNNAQDDATNIINRAKIDAEKAATLEYEKKKELLAQDVEKTKDDIHQEMVDIALLVSQEVIGREIDEKDQARLVDEMVTRLEKGNDNE